MEFPGIARRFAEEGVRIRRRNGTTVPTGSTQEQSRGSTATYPRRGVRRSLGHEENAV